MNAMADNMVKKAIAEKHKASGKPEKFCFEKLKQPTEHCAEAQSEEEAKNKPEQLKEVETDIFFSDMDTKSADKEEDVDD